jgi:THO complex subunit 5
MAECALESVGALHALCDNLRRELARATELKKTSPSGAHARMAVSDGSMSLLELKEVNRTVWEQIAALKARSHGANQEVDAADLKLQNLQYEKNCVLREIRLLRDYPPDKPIELLSKEEFLRLAPPGTVTEEKDAHGFHVARLQLELDQRASLCEQRDQLLAERQRLEDSITSRRTYL